MFEDNSNIYMINKENGESNRFYYDKCLFVSKCSPYNKKTLDYYLRFANIFCNKKYNGCIYDNHIETILKKIIEDNNIIL